MEWLGYFGNYMAQLRKTRKQIVLCGDYNIAHHPIDIHDPVGNKKSSGFLPEEREWLSQFLSAGWVDTYRELHPGIQKYSWWTFRAGARAKNKGWRIDYNLVTDTLRDRVISADILNSVVHSDHCPVLVELRHP